MLVTILARDDLGGATFAPQSAPLEPRVPSLFPIQHPHQLSEHCATRPPSPLCSSHNPATPLYDRPSHTTMISSGFTNAPVSQFLVFGTVIGALAATITDTRYYLPIAVVPHVWGYGQLWRFVTWSWVFTNSTEVLFGVLSLYQLRVVERLWGSRKFLVRRAYLLTQGGC